MLKLRRLEIEKFRSVRPGTVLEFNDGVNVLLGKNGTGKTTLLKLVAAAASGNFFEFREEEFALQWEMSFAKFGLRCSVEHRQGSPLPRLDTASLDVEPLVGKPAWTSRFELEISTGGIPPSTATWVDGRLSIRRGDQVHELETRTSFVTDGDVSFIAALVLELRWIAPAPIHARRSLAQLNRVVRFDESLVWFYRAVVRTAALQALQPSGQDARTTVYRRLGMPSQLFSQVTREALSHPPPEALEARSDHSEFLDRACRALGFSQCIARLEFDRSELGSREFLGVKETIFYKGLRFFFTKRDETRITHEHLSFGQQRLFAFLYYAEIHAENVVVADELTNGLHHSMIELCLETIGERQAFLATQNPLLLDHIGFESAEQVRGTFVLCDLDVAEDGRDVMRWHNMSEEQAREFFADYEVGIQHVNDILRTRGLW
jgi:hypothetical protein